MFCSTTTSSGKTLLTSATAKLLSDKGLRVVSAKVGPDFIDPQYHEIATNHPCINLDAVLISPKKITSLISEFSTLADFLIIEGVMGLFDGTSLFPPAYRGIPFGSSAHLAILTKTPVILVVDAAKKGHSVAAEINGFLKFNKEVPIKGIIINNLSSATHEEIIKRSLEDIKELIIGYLYKDSQIKIQKRYLGLYAPKEDPRNFKQILNYACHAFSTKLNLKKLIAIAKDAPQLVSGQPLKSVRTNESFRLAFCKSKAFSFYYQTTENIFKKLGAQICYIDPLKDENLPDCTQGLYLPGGYPELYLAELSQNKPLIKDITKHHQHGMPIWAECGGLMYLSKKINKEKLASILPVLIKKSPTLKVGYRIATTNKNSPLGKKGTYFFAHEHHYYEAVPSGKDIKVKGFNLTKNEGFLTNNIFASFLHLELTDHVELAENFAKKARSFTNGN